MATDAALQNMALKTVAGIVAKHERDVKRALGALLADLGLTIPAVLRGVEFRG